MLLTVVPSSQLVHAILQLLDPLLQWITFLLALFAFLRWLVVCRMDHFLQLNFRVHTVVSQLFLVLIEYVPQFVNSAIHRFLLKALVV